MTTDVRHPVFARLYNRLSEQMEAAGGGEHRRRLLAGLTGEMIEVGAGNGLNLRHYPGTVTRVLAVEPEPYLREKAARNAARSSVPVDVVAGTAEALPAADATFDAAVCSLVLCSVAEPSVALAEIRRVLKPGGELRFYEHVRAEGRSLARLQRAMDATFWPKMAGGCHAGRDTVAEITRAGFVVEALEVFRFPEGRVPVPTSPHVIGSARVG